MLKRLSSAWTFYFKVLLPTLWIGGFTLGSILLLFDVFKGRDGRPPSPAMKLFFPVVTIIGAAFLYWCCIRLKDVWMDKESLVISNFIQEVRVPLQEVIAVTENPWINIHPVTIVFSGNTAFGERIMFMPRIRWLGFWTSHPVVEEIRSAAVSAGAFVPVVGV